jgi:hypothetical protein
MLSIVRYLPLLLLATSGFAQQTVSGWVQSTDGQPLPFATVLLQNAHDSSLVKGALTDASGLYIFDHLKSGHFQVMVSMIGYQNAYSPAISLPNAGPVFRVDPLVIKAHSKQLNEVTVTAKKPPFEQQLDKLVVNVSGMITAAGGSVLDVLERSPGVRVDRQNGGISMGGRDGVMVMINGKLSRLPLDAVVQLLSGMNAVNVEKVELITNPPAKYDAEGNAGLINIVLKRNQTEGTNGSFALMGGYGRYEKTSGSLSLNHNQGRFNLFSTISYNYDNRWFDFEAIRSQRVQQELWHNYQLSDRFTKRHNGDCRVGAEISIRPQSTLSAQVQAMNNTVRATSYNTSNTRLNTQSQPFTESKMTWLEVNPWRNLGGSLGFLHRFSNQQTFSIDADYQHYTNNISNTLAIDQFVTTDPQTTPLQSVNTYKGTTIQFWVIRADYSRSLATNWKLESGLKFNRSDIENALGVERQIDGRLVTDSDQTSTARFSENIGAAYVNLTGKLTPKTDFQGGFRIEATHTNIQTFEGKPVLDRRYLNLFPNALIKHQWDPNQALQFAFSRRLTRPSFNELTPSFYMTDPNTSYLGNIGLKPAYTSTARAGYVVRDRYFFWLGYSHERNSINKHQPVISPDRPELTHITQNFDRADLLSVEFTFPVSITSWWKTQNNLAGYYREAKTQFNIGPFQQQTFFGTINSVHTFSFGNRWTAELSVSYRSLTPFGVMNLRSMTNVVAGIQKVLPKNRGTFRLTINDILWKNQLRWHTAFPEQQFEFRGTLRDSPRIVKLTYTRSFGNQKTKIAPQRKGAEEELKRVTF